MWRLGVYFRGPRKDRPYKYERIFRILGKQHKNLKTLFMIYLDTKKEEI
jgi:hypothetical protein